MKYRLLVVEDDNNIREGLIKIIHKMELPIESLSAAGNGSEALEAVRAEEPHIVITDIKMPSMNGLDFIERLKESGSRAKLIILSGYSEFSFAQRAISFNVSEYLLKPVKKDKLRLILLKLMEQVRQEEEESERKRSSEKKIRDYHSTLLKEILEGYQNAGDIDFIFSNAGLTFGKSGFVIYSLYCKASPGQLSDFLDRNAESLDIRFKYITRYQHIICLVNVETAGYRQACLQLDGKAAAFASDNRGRVYAGVSEWTDTTANLAELVKQAEKAMDFRLFDKAGRVFYYHEIKSLPRLKPALKSYYDEMSRALEQADLQGLYTGIDRMFDFLQQLSPLTPGLFRNAIAGFILYSMPPDRQEFTMSSINSIDDIYQLSDSLVDLRRNVKQMFCALIQSGRTDSVNTSNSKINAAIRYIDENYSRNISLEDVAGHIRFNASYFSNTFRKITGMYFSDYLQNVRVEKSKALLMQPGYKIYEIAENVGFLDEKYYFKVFKKITGVTPSQYRNGVRSQP